MNISTTFKPVKKIYYIKTKIRNCLEINIRTKFKLQLVYKNIHS